MTRLNTVLGFSDRVSLLEEQQNNSDHFPQGVAVEAGVLWAQGTWRAVRGGERDVSGGGGATTAAELLRRGYGRGAACISCKGRET